MRNTRLFRYVSAFLITACCATALHASVYKLRLASKNYIETFWGDSLTAGAGAVGVSAQYPFVVANTGPAGRWYFNGGIGGQTSTQIGVRQGGVATTATIVGGSIPTTGGVTVTFPVGFEPVTSQGPLNGTNGTISGVYGNVSLSGGTYTFTRTIDGAPVSVSSSPFVVDASGLNVGTVAIWAGRNNYAFGAQVQSDIAAMVGVLPSARYVVLSIINAEGEGVGTAGYNQIIALNAALSTTYGSRFLDVRTALVAAYNPANALDVIDHGNDVPPFSLRAVNVNGTITQTINSSDTTFTLSAPVSNNYILLVGSEYIYVNSVSGSTVTSATRGYGGSLAAGHTTGTAFAGTDNLHLSNAGYAVVAAQVYAPIANNGW